MNTSLDGVIGGTDDENSNAEIQNSNETPSKDEHHYANQLFETADTIILDELLMKDLQNIGIMLIF